MRVKVPPVATGRSPGDGGPTLVRRVGIAAASLALSLSQVAVTVARASDAAAAAIVSGDVEFGEYLSAECVTCHRLSGAYDGIPPIIGWPAEHFYAVMLEYRHKKRANPVMQTIASRLSDEEIGALAAYFAQLTPK